jgi:hypothetical protein
VGIPWIVPREKMRWKRSGKMACGILGGKGRLLVGFTAASFLGGLAGGVISSGGWALAQKAMFKEKLIVTEELRIVDKRGRTLASFSSHGGAGRIRLVDSSGKTRLMAGVDPGGETFLSLHDSRGDFRVILGTWLEGDPKLLLLDGREAKRAALELQEGEEPLLRLRDSRGRSRLEVKGGREGDPSILVLDREEKVRAHLGFTEDDDVILNFSDGKESPRLALGVQASGEPLIQMADEAGRLRLTIGEMEAHGAGQESFSGIAILDDKGNFLWTAP